MSKFSVNDHVRVTNPNLPQFDSVGFVASYAEVQCQPAARVIFPGSGAGFIFKQSSLTLADPDVHTVLDEMDAESAPCITADQWAKAVTPPNRRAVVLRTAESLVNGQRADDYGPPQENFGRVAAMWSAQFAAKLKEPLTADEVAIALVHLKLSRLANTPDHADSFIDAAGYIALAAEIAEGL